MSRFKCQSLYLDLLKALDDEKIQEYKRRLQETVECDKWTNFEKVRRFNSYVDINQSKKWLEKNRNFVYSSLYSPVRFLYNLK